VVVVEISATMGSKQTASSIIRDRYGVLIWVYLGSGTI